jgi:hypothetical protein
MPIAGTLVLKLLRLYIGRWEILKVDCDSVQNSAASAGLAVALLAVVASASMTQTRL